MNNITTYLIHNNSISRVNIRKEIKTLIKSLNIDLVEIFQQESLSNLKTNLRYKFSIIRIQYLRLNSLRLKFKKGNSFKFYKSYIYFLIKIFIFVLKIIFQNKKKDLEHFRHLKIEQIVTKKHIRAWERFLKTNSNIIIVFEDDALVKNDSRERLQNLIKKLHSIDFEYLFLDLAGGYKYEEVIPKQNIFKTDKNNIYIRGLFTNTACSYLMNRCLVEKLYTQFYSSDLNINFTIDHLLNKLNSELKRPEKTLSLHFLNPIFTHGSFKGTVKSWQID